MSTLAVATIKSISSAAPVFQNTSGTEKGQLVKAWINFNGDETVAIRDSFNVSSITDNGNGVYKVDIDANMNASTYCLVISTGANTNNNQTSQNGQLFSHSTKTAGSFKIRHGNTANNSATDCGEVNAVVFGAN